MSDQDEHKPLTRRERRQREMEETSGTPILTAEIQQELRSRGTAEQEQPAADEQPAAPDPALAPDIEISPTDETGRLRTRREIRELRQAALESWQAEQALTGSAAIGQLPADFAAPEEDERAYAARRASADTEPFDFRAEERERETAPPRTSAEQPDAPGDVAEAASEDAQAGTAKDTAAESAPADEGESQNTYSFPDIVPLDEERSVFDDPSVVTVTPPGRPSEPDDAHTGGGFEDMIVRAVADEGASNTSNTSALILPALPDSAELAGPLGETGELYITGSIELPKSLGETGGHARLHDTVEPGKTGDLDIGSEYESGEHQAVPVSAHRAVSSYGDDSNGLVVPKSQKDTKKPLILALSGAGLLVVVAGLGVWAATSGFFG